VFACAIDHVYRLPSPVVLQPGTYWLRNECSVTYFECWFQLEVTGNVSKVSRDAQTWGDNVFGEDIAFALRGEETVTPEAQVNDLHDLLAGMGLPDGVANSLVTKLLAVLAAIEEGDAAGACSDLRAFVNEVTAQSGKKLTAEQAAELLAAANALREDLGC
jgi:hypothetical protein